jgi:hypothetical protein
MSVWLAGYMITASIQRAGDLERSWQTGEGSVWLCRPATSTFDEALRPVAVAAWLAHSVGGRTEPCRWTPRPKLRSAYYCYFTGARVDEQQPAQAIKL